MGARQIEQYEVGGSGATEWIDEDDYDEGLSGGLTGNTRRECESCGEAYNEEDMGFSEEGICDDCVDAGEADRQMRDDYYFWAR